MGWGVTARAIYPHFSRIQAHAQDVAPPQNSLEVDRTLLDLNGVGTISFTKAVLPHMIERHEGQIVVVSSVVGKFGKYH